jgi:thiol peroxidase
MGAVSLKDSAGKVRMFNVVPSLDTPVCSIQTKRFSEEFNALGDKVVAYTISLDLPFAMKRFCSENKIENLANLSDVHNLSFGEHYGVLINNLPIKLLARAIFVVDAHDKLSYVEIVPEIATEPNYDAALAAIKAATA